MNEGHHASRCRSQYGMSLTELMIGMAVGLVVVIALAYFFLGSRMISRTTDDVSRMQESGRKALEVMGSAIRQAGYRQNVNAAFPGSSLGGTDGASSAPDSITVRYDAQDGGEVDCTGTNIPSGVITYAFVVDTAANPPALTCNGTVVAENIENLQVAYGIDTSKTGQISSYKTAPSAAEFLQVAAVRVSLVVRGPSTNVATNKSQTYTFNGASVTKTDGYLRQVYGATFTVRNQAW